MIKKISAGFLPIVMFLFSLDGVAMNDEKSDVVLKKAIQSCSICKSKIVHAWPHSINTCKSSLTAHKFCTGCIAQWIVDKKNTGCPLCGDVYKQGKRFYIHASNSLREKDDLRSFKEILQQAEHRLNVWEERELIKTRSLETLMTELTKFMANVETMSSEARAKNNELNVLLKTQSVAAQTENNELKATLRQRENDLSWYKTSTKALGFALASIGGYATYKLFKSKLS